MRIFDMELEEGKVYQVKIKSANFVYDANYGADIDGNRGQGEEFLEDLVIDRVTYEGKEVIVDRALQEIIEDYICTNEDLWQRLRGME